MKLKSLPLSKEKVLYHGSLLLNKEIDKIKKYLNDKVENLPGAIIFSKLIYLLVKMKILPNIF